MTPPTSVEAMALVTTAGMLTAADLPCGPDEVAEITASRDWALSVGAAFDADLQDMSMLRPLSRALTWNRASRSGTGSGGSRG